MVRGEVIKGSEEIKVIMMKFYEKLYRIRRVEAGPFSSLWTAKFFFRRNKRGCRGLSQKQRCYILLNSDGDKAPGPDDFIMCFFRACWETLREDLMQIIHNFHQNEFLEKSFNATFIALIPKKFKAQELKDFSIKLD